MAAHRLGTPSTSILLPFLLFLSFLLQLLPGCEPVHSRAHMISVGRLDESPASQKVSWLSVGRHSSGELEQLHGFSRQLTKD
jgi:hypothetical protein